MFAADLLRKLDAYVRLDCVRVSSYKDEDRPVTEPEIIDQIRLDLTQQHVLLIDDILDTGHTLAKVTRILRAQKPASLNTCVLLNKKGRRQTRIAPDFVGFTIPNHFVVGYGLDASQQQGRQGGVEEQAQGRAHPATMPGPNAHVKTSREPKLSFYCLHRGN